LGKNKKVSHEHPGRISPICQVSAGTRKGNVTITATKVCEGKKKKNQTPCVGWTRKNPFGANSTKKSTGEFLRPLKGLHLYWVVKEASTLGTRQR